jgi:DNA-binding NarL/FixJ family response regulator
MVVGGYHDPTAELDQVCLNTRATHPRVFILSDFRALYEGLVLALEQQASVMVVGLSDGLVSPIAIAGLRPEVLLLDSTMVGGLDTCNALRQLLPDLLIVAIAVAGVEREVIACAEAGVAGFVSRSGSVRDVVTAIHWAVGGEFFCSPCIAALMFARFGAMLAGREDIPSGNGRLTRREQEIVSLLGDGLCNKDIARKLLIQNATVKNHIHSILGKMHMKRRTDVAARFRRAEPTSLN